MIDDLEVKVRIDVKGIVDKMDEKEVKRQC